jgi:hypothetical protein
MEEHNLTIVCIQAAPGRDPDPLVLHNAIKDGWIIGTAYGVAHPTGNSILHYFVLHRPFAVADPLPLAGVKPPDAPAVPTSGSGVRPPQGRRR